MKWQGKRKSSNLEDRRGLSGRRSNMGGINPMLLGPLMRLLFSKWGLIIVGGFLVFSFVTGNNPLNLISQIVGGSPITSTSNNYKGSAEEDNLAQFTNVILASTEDVWNAKLSNYREPKLVLFTNSVNSACGFASSATGPFYCPGDEKIYIDLGFFMDMGKKLNAPGDFAQAYVIAHEVGHHIQKIMGTIDKLNQLRRQLPKKEYNKYNVRLELQADFLAGVWAHHAQKKYNWLEAGDIEEALNAASAVGDDRLQKKATGQVVPDAFTHGTSAQRLRWFKKGFETGDFNQGDTFSIPYSQL